MRLLYSLFLCFLVFEELSATRTFVFDDYMPNLSGSKEGLKLLRTSSDLLAIKPSDIEVSKILGRLNEKPGDIEHFQEYTAQIKREKDLEHMFQVAVYLMKSPISYKEYGVETLHAGTYFIDSRCLDLLNFVYLTNPKLSPWLSYYYAISLLHFPDRAITLYEITKPIESAFVIYDQWLEYLSNEHYFEQE